MPAQTSVAKATCSPLNSELSVIADSAPTATCRTNTKSVACAIAPTPFSWPRQVQPRRQRRTAVVSTCSRTRPTTSTVPRCSIVNASTPAKLTLNPPPQRGQDLQAWSALLATTLDPVSSIRYVAPVAMAARRRKAGSPTPVAAGIAITAVATKDPRIIIARPRCTSTSQEASSFTTTTPPSAPSPTTPISDAVASHATAGRRVRQTTHARTTVAMISTPVTLPTARCEYSMIA